MQNVLIIIQARMGSTRLPGKVLLPLGNKTVIEHVFERCNQVANTVVAIPDTAENDVLSDFLDQKGIPRFKGAEFDLTKRYLDCAEYYKAKTVVRITSDCPLIQPEMIKIALAFHDGVYTVYEKNTSGLDVQVYDIEFLRQCNEMASTDVAREHLIPQFKDSDSYNPIRKLSLDTPEDYDLLNLLISRLN